ncbi:MAG: serine hydrolase domain-containing protein, partial [Pseudomonadota bacterium]|nr:serine hydrolase domain-containing protein [Pseudomonadota bacterium]
MKHVIIGFSLSASGLAMSADAQDPAAIEQAILAVLEEYGAAEHPTRFAGASVALHLSDDRTIAVATGHADREAGIEMRTDHRLLGGSMGKTFVAAALMALVEDGRVALDDRAAQYLAGQDWFDPLPNSAEVTLEQLLNHSSGIPIDYFETEPIREALRLSAVENLDLADQGLSHEDLLRPLGGLEPLFAVGEGFRYSDANYTIIAFVVEHVSGQTLEAFVDERFIQPLGLSETERQRREMPRLTAAYMHQRFQQTFPGIPTKAGDYERLTYDPAFEWGGGGWAFTATDLARWGDAWFSGEALSDEYLDLMRTSLNHHGAADNGWSYGIGLQWQQTLEGDERWY